MYPLYHQSVIPNKAHISSKFPLLDEVEANNSIGTTTISSPQECQCPRRTKPPPTPSSLPYLATEANREKLQQYLLTLLLSTLGADTDTAQPHKSTLPQATVTPEDMMRLFHPNKTKCVGNTLLWSATIK